MKNTLFVIAFTAIGFACNQNPTGTETETETAKVHISYFGDSITQENVQDAQQLSLLMKGKDSLGVKLKGKIADVCQKKGCWMDMDMGGQQTMRVVFKDYGFFVPKDIGGKNVIIDGIAYNDTTSVDDLRHYAEDAGKTKEDIEKITEPEVSVSFEARGVIIY